MGSFRDGSVNVVLHAGDQEADGLPAGDFLVGPFVSPHALDQRDGEGVELIRLMRLVHDGQRNSEPQPFQVPHFFAQSDDFREKIHLTRNEREARK